MSRHSRNMGRSSWRRPISRIAHAAGSAVETLESRVLLSVNVTSYHYDAAEDGANTNETILTPSNVNTTTFGKIASLPVDAQVYAQPLIMTGVSVSGGTEDLVFVATENDSVYAFNAEGGSTTPVWKDSLLQTGEAPIPYGDTGTNDITPIIGITSTPVINTATNTMYVEGNFLESNGTFQQRLYQLNISTGATVNDVVISGSVPGTGAGSSGGTVAFNALLENQRPALTLANGQVYVTFASHGDNGNYHGWVVAYNDTTLVQDYVWCDTPNGEQGGIWMSGGGLAVDSSGDLYLTSGNGTFDANTGGSDYGMALVKLSPSLQVLDYFSPYNEASLSNGDQDYGCGNAILLTNQTGSAPNETLTLGKWGGVYLNNAATGSMGEINNPPNGPNKDLGETSTNLEQHNTFAYFNGEVYIGPDGGTLRDYAVSGGTLATKLSTQSTHVFGSTSVDDGQGAGVSVSSDGTSDGIVWALDNSGFNSSPAVLYAYNPANLSQVYWASNQYGNRDTCGDAVKFTTPVVANGLVYVGGAGTLTIYGNIPPAPPLPPPPPPPPIPSNAVAGFSKFTLNRVTGNPTGVPSISSDNNTLTLTTNVGNEASSAIYNTPVGYQNFTAEFTYTDSQGSPPADGMTFMLENDSRGATALGANGGSLGYTGTGDITPSFAVEFNVYQGSTTGDAENGGSRLNNQSTGSVTLSSGDPINIVISYNSSTQTVSESLTDTVTNNSYSTSYTGINLSSILGANTAYMGFTGGTGGSESLQTVTNFGYFAQPLVTSVSPTSGPSAGGTSVTINGTSFTGATAVDFGSTPATSFSVNSTGTQITATDPAGGGTVDVTVVTPSGTSATSSADQFTYVNTLPAWLAAGSAATWNSSTDTLTVTGSATIIADPGSAEPNIVASGTAAKLAITPATNPTDVHIGGVTLTNGASIVMSDVDASQVASGTNAANHASDHNVLVIGTLGATSDPTISIDSASKLDLGDNDLIVHTGTSDTGTTDVQGYKETNELTAIEALAATGRNVAPGGVFNGTWTGNGLTSSAAATADDSANAGYEQNILAVEQNSDMYLGGYSKWTVGSATETLGANDIIVKYTYNGDLNLDGAVDGNAATIFSTFYDNGATSANTYAYGDLNGDGKINGNDATIFSTVYGNGLASSGLPQL